MNFELLDNTFQVSVLVCSALIAAIEAFRGRGRRFLILSFAYTCTSMGTLFWVLHIAITGNTPHTFYVSEISWIAAYFFYLSLQIVRMDGIRLSFSLSPALSAVLTATTIIVPRIMGPSYFISTTFAFALASIMYLSVFMLKSGKAHRKVDYGLIICIVLQISLYLVSSLFSDYTRFNLYFAVDFALTASFVALLPLNLREVTGK